MTSRSTSLRSVNRRASFLGCIDARLVQQPEVELPWPGAALLGPGDADLLQVLNDLRRLGVAGRIVVDHVLRVAHEQRAGEHGGREAPERNLADQQLAV